MRYILNSEGYVEAVTFGGFITCNNNSCTEYAGSVPSGYETLEEWNDNANIRAYKIVDGNLVYDSDKDTELQTLWEIQEANNQSEIVGNKVTTIDSTSTDKQYPSAKAVYNAISEGGGGSGGDSIPTGSVIGYNGDTIPEGYEEVESPNIYSTEEIVIGYFVKSDGTKKPVYRMFKETNVTTTGNITLIETGSLDDIFDMTIYKKTTGNHEAFDMTKWWSVRSTGKITAVISSTGVYTCCITYTKTTD